MTTHPILGPIAPVESLGRAMLEAIESSGGCSVSAELAGITARGLELPALGQWLPIESAPKNTGVLVFQGGSQHCAWLQDDASDEFWEEGDEPTGLNGLWCVTDNKLGPFALRGGQPTHWTPLPPPPTKDSP
jgi:hypothetical protein